MKKKRSFFVIILVIILIAICFYTADFFMNKKFKNEYSYLVTELTSEDGVHFKFSPENKTLVISGETAGSHIGTANLDYWLENTEKIILEKGVKEVGHSLEYYYNAREIEISDTVERIGGSLNLPCLEKYMVDKNNPFFYNDENGVLYSYGKEDESKNTVIKLPSKYPSEEYVVPDNVSEIASGAFEECENLKHIRIGKNYDGGLLYVFNNCPYIETVTVHSDNKSYCNDEQGVVYNKEMNGIVCIPRAVEEYIVPDGAEFLFDYRFVNLGIKKLIFNDSGVPLRCFKNLEEIFIGEGNENICSIDNVVFNKDKTVLSFYPPMKSDETYEVPSSVVEIGYDSFYCDKLKNLIIPDSVNTIKARAFYNASSIETISIGKGTQTIEGMDYFVDYIDNPFIQCDSLKAITVNKENEYFANDELGALYSKDMRNLICYPSKSIHKEYTIPDTVSEINFCFANCTEIEVINFGKNVERITVNTYIDGYSFF